MAFTRFLQVMLTSIDILFPLNSSGMKHLNSEEHQKPFRKKSEVIFSKIQKVVQIFESLRAYA